MESQKLQAAPASPSNSGQPWLASRLLQRQVVNASTVEPVGRVADIVFDCETCQISALMIERTPVEGGRVAAFRRALGWRRGTASIGIDRIIALNGDVVMVDSNPSLAAFSHSTRQLVCLCEVCELTVITLHGICLGLLADVLLDNQGSTVTGYMVKTTGQAESLPQLFDEFEQLLPLDIEDRVSDGDRSPDAESPSVHLRVIPASPRVRFGEELIILLDDVEPLRQDPVVITSDSTGSDEQAAQHNAPLRRWMRWSDHR